MKLTLKRLALVAAGAAYLTIYGCGGGGGSSFGGLAPGATPTADAAVTPVVTTPPAAPTTPVAITVVDGPIQNATVCLDKNNNGACDTGEPTGKTDATGKVTLNVDQADVGKYAVVAVVGTDAVDSDTGAVPTRFTLKAPADKSGVVSPLTTLVQSLIDSTGVSSAAAAVQVQAQTGINVSLFEDFTKSTTSTDSAAAATIARLLVVTTQQHISQLGTAVGGKDLDGAVITREGLDKVIQNKLLEVLPALLTALADPAVLAAKTTPDKEKALLAQAQMLVSTSGLTTASVATLVAVNNQTSSSTSAVADVPTAGASLRLLNFTDVNNLVVRVFASSLAQATPNAAGLTRSVQRRYSVNSGSTAAWTTIGNVPLRQADLHFNGTAWVGCALNTEDTNTVRDAKGISAYNSCDNYETGTSNRASFDISGKTMLEVYNQVIAAGYTNITISNSSTVLGSTTFPANSKLLYQTSSIASTAVGYYPGSSNYVAQYSKAVSDGGLASSQAAGTGCNSAEFATSAATNSTTLETMITSMTGTPCIFGPSSFTYNSVQYTSPDSTNEAWGNSTLALGTLGSAPVGTGATAPGFYSGNTRLRIAFKGTGTNPVTYYACKERFNNGASLNCTVIGAGNYTIASKSDARIMTLSNPPLLASNLGYQRVFVERGGKIFFGYQSNLGALPTARLNLAATNALFAKLGLPAVDPETPLALTKASYAGEYRLIPSGNPGAYVSLFINANGSSSSTYTNSSGVTGPSEATAITFTNLATGEFTSFTTGSGAKGTGTANFLTGAVTLNLNDPSSTPSNVVLTGARR